tara:strand:- start:629 stop:880 length:252 start_codon:yes stop_codon:yes gene_type:complete
VSGQSSRSRTEPFGFSDIYDIAAQPTDATGKLSTANFTLAINNTGSKHTALLDSAGIVRSTVNVIGVTTGVRHTFEVSVKYTL